MPFRRAFLLILALGLVACDDGEPTDAGMEDGSVGDDAGAPFVCERTMVLDGVLDDTVEVTFDTTMTMTRPQDLGLNCGNADAEARWAPQEVVEYRVPGDQPVSIEFTTINAETTENMIVFVQARFDACENIQAARFPPFCFGPVAPSPPAREEDAEWRSTGQLVANGGDTIFFFVTGFSEPPADARMLTDRGTVRLEITARLNEIPTLDSALVVLDGDDVRVEATGSDPNANARGALLNFYNAAGDMLDLYGDGAATLEFSVFQVRFDDPVSTGFDWSGGTWVRSTPMDGATQLGEYLNAVGATQALVRAYDAPNGVTEGMMVPIREATIVGFGEACDAVTLCRPEMECDMMTMTCGPSTVISDRCNAAEDAALPAFTDTAVSVTVMNNTRSEPSNFSPADGCVGPGEADGGESVYTIDAPATFDLLLTTELPGTGATDTVVYVRRGCFDQGSELGCNNDGMTVGSSLELRDLAPGGYFIYVEERRQMDPPGSGAHELQITARPVLGAGAACDMAETLNRCMNGPCAAGTCP